MWADIFCSASYGPGWIQWYLWTVRQNKSSSCCFARWKLLTNNEINPRYSTLSLLVLFLDPSQVLFSLFVHSPVSVEWAFLRAKVWIYSLFISLLLGTVADVSRLQWTTGWDIRRWLCCAPIGGRRWDAMLWVCNVHPKFLCLNNWSPADGMSWMTLSTHTPILASQQGVSVEGI